MKTILRTQSSAWVKALALLTMTTLLLVCLTPWVQADDAPVGNPAAQIVTLINAQRAEAGLNPLTGDESLQAAAQIRAQEAAQAFSHTRPDGTEWSTVFTEVQIDPASSAECLAKGQNTPQEVVDAWMANEPQRDILMSPDYTLVVVGAQEVDGTSYWSLLIATL